MAFVIAYTKQGDSYFNCVNESMHLALSENGREYELLRNNTGVLFPLASFTERKIEGTTKTLRYPWIFSKKDGSYGVCCVRRNQDGKDPLSEGSVMLFSSENLIRYQETGFLKVADTEIRDPRCCFDEKKDAYYLEWETDAGIFCGTTRHFCEIHDVKALEKFSLEKFTPGETDNLPITTPAWNGETEVLQYGNILEVSEECAEEIRKHFGVIYNTAVAPVELIVKAGQAPAQLPKAVCLYSDGSVHEKIVDWDENTLKSIDFSKTGEYHVPGVIRQKHYPFPWIDAMISDPCITYYNGKYYLSGSGQRSVTFRISDTLEGLRSAEPVDVYTMPEEDKEHANMWAQELHIVKGVPCVFTTVGGKQWHTVRSHVLRCTGDPGAPGAWEEPRLVMKPDGTELNENGISLDMTYFCVDGVHYVMWSGRSVIPVSGRENPDCDPADVLIATVDPDQPWQLTTNPARVCHPSYGWDRLHQEVDEGPYLLRHGDDLFITISGASTGIPEYYCLGFLHAKRGANLLSADGWDWIPYPFLTKESVPGEYGPGHNNFIKEPETGDDLLVYHAVPHDEHDRSMGRHMGIRRVHWAASGYPYLEMTEERDLNPELKNITMKVLVEE